jgi:fumarylacetoacetate (FAA) hydrolase
MLGAGVRLCTFSAAGGPPLPGRIEGDRVVELRAESLVAVLASGEPAADAGEHALADARLCAPVPEPPSVRDFFAFEQHVATARANRGAEVPREWYGIPVFYFSNPAAIFGPEDAVPYPRGTRELDYELEVAAVIGAGGRIAGFTVMNDWSARDLQREEVRVGLGPAKGKDFATSLGPVLVTVDEFDGRAAAMVARVNGEERSRGDLRDLYHPWDAILDRAALNTRLRPGDVIGSGTVGTGCILEANDGRWLQVGDVVELEVEGLGVLRNTVARGR